MTGDDSDRITLIDVARAAGVSRSTVSLVLRGRPNISDETRTRVRAVMADLGYVYNRAAANLRARRTQTLGLIVCSLANPFFGEMAEAVDETLADMPGDWASFLVNTGECSERQLAVLRRMREHGMDAVILSAAGDTSAQTLLAAHSRDMPIILVLRRVGEDVLDFVCLDNLKCVELLVDHLYGLGHRRFAFVGGEQPHSATRDRHNGFVVSMSKRSLDASLLVKTPASFSAGAASVAALMDRSDPPTALICYNDVVAFGVIRGLADRGLEAGKDVAVTGFDDIAEARLRKPALTTISSMAHTLGRVAARLALQRIADPGRPIEHIILDAPLIIRESCGTRLGPRRD
jgi:LacI family transcriptional regulator